MTQTMQDAPTQCIVCERELRFVPAGEPDICMNCRVGRSPESVDLDAMIAVVRKIRGEMATLRAAVRRFVAIHDDEKLYGPEEDHVAHMLEFGQSFDALRAIAASTPSGETPV